MADKAPRFRQPKAQQFSTTTAAPLSAYNGPSTPGYFDDAAAGYNDYDDGYNYPVPSNPLPLPTSTTQPPPSYNPSTSGMAAHC